MRVESVDDPSCVRRTILVTLLIATAMWEVISPESVATCPPCSTCVNGTVVPAPCDPGCDTLTTNCISGSITNVWLTAVPSGVLCAGEPITATVHYGTSNGWRIITSANNCGNTTNALAVTLDHYQWGVSGATITAGGGSLDSSVTFTGACGNGSVSCTVYGKSVDASCTSNSISLVGSTNFTVLCAESLTATPSGEGIGGDTNLYCWANSGVVAVTGGYCPSSVPTNQLPGCWTITGGHYSNIITRAVSRATAAVTPVIVTAGACAKTNVIIVLKTEFAQGSNCSGFDESVDPHWLMVPKGGNNVANAEIEPAANAALIQFICAGNATVSPASASGSPQTITVTGVTKGETDVHTGPVNCRSLGITVKEKINRTVAIHAITEQNDDVQVIASGNGKPEVKCIDDGANNILESIGDADDGTHPHYVDTGANGKCETTANNLDPTGDDANTILVGKGSPNELCVSAGVNGFRDTPAAVSDDVIDGDDINAGPDGICNTTANNANVVPYNVPTAASLESYLNDVYGKQANAYFTVTRTDATLNYDLDRNGGVPDPPDESEMDAIAAGAATAGVDGNLYFVRVMDAPIATARSSDAFIQSDTGGTAENVAAHELGHILGLPHNNSDNSNLMHESSVNGCRLVKSEWDTLNP